MRSLAARAPSWIERIAWFSAVRIRGVARCATRPATRIGPDVGAARVRERPGNLRHERTEQRMPKTRSDFGQRRHHEVPLGRSRMGNHELGGIDPLLTENENVQIQPARAPTLGLSPPITSHQPLDSMQPSQQFERIDPDPQLDDRIQIGILAGRSDRIRFQSRRSPDEREIGILLDRLDRGRERCLPVPQIGTERDVDDFSASSHRSLPKPDRRRIGFVLETCLE